MFRGSHADLGVSPESRVGVGVRERALHEVGNGTLSAMLIRDTKCVCREQWRCMPLSHQPRVDESPFVIEDERRVEFAGPTLRIADDVSLVAGLHYVKSAV